MHSGLAILVWMTAAVVLQALSGPTLFATLIVVAAAAALLARERAGRLVRRVRFLMLAIAVLFIGFTPGEAILADWPSLSPSREGLLLAAEHAGRLLGVVLGVAILLECLSVSRLVSGLYALLRPFEPLGLPARGLAVRLLLVLHYAESAAPRDWRAWLEDRGGHQESWTIRLHREPMELRDVALTIAAMAVLITIGAVQ